MCAKRMEKKGSLSLRSDHMDYGRETLVSNWHEAREAEPKDHDINAYKPSGTKNRRLHQSTYNRILDVTGKSAFTISTCHDHMNQYKLKEDFEEKTSRLPMVNYTQNLDNRTTNSPERGFGSILPRHCPHHNKRYFETTYEVDYKDTYPCKEIKPKTSSPHLVVAYKKMHSQFGDVADYRRQGANTWHDESGLYANKDVESDILNRTNPITHTLY